jgi:hypothetical protein
MVVFCIKNQNSTASKLRNFDNTKKIREIYSSPGNEGKTLTGKKGISTKN